MDAIKIHTRCWITIALLLFCWVWPGLAAESTTLTILHTNDTHGRLLPFNYPDDVMPASRLAGLPERRDIGGIARRATLVRQIRAARQQRDATPVILVDAGDFSDGTPFSTEYHGEADIAAMNAVGYDFATLGNHEFNYSLAHTRKLMALARYPVLCANAIDRATGRPFTTPYAIRSFGPLKVALFGLVTPSAANYPGGREGVAIADPLATAGRMATELRAQADLVILLSHCGDEIDQRIASRVEDIDVIVGGHSHSRLPTGKFVWHSAELKADDVNGTIIVQNHQWGGELGRLDMLFVRDEVGAWRVDRYRAQLLPITAAIPEDSAVAAVVAHFWQPIAPRYGEVIGQAEADFVTRQGDLAEYNLMADAIRATFKTDFVLENIGGVRAPLVRGTITRADLVAMDPFDDTIVTFTISGKDLKQLLRQRQPAVSGVRYRIAGSDLAEATCGGRSLSDQRIYTGAVNSFIARRWLKNRVVQDTGRRRLDVLVDYIRERGRIAPAYDGRRVIVAP
ncbi:MAG: hypothetical protein VR64_02895 [Desulfatitalea sp. BRH_c12]|nr:MAG: hypothetical protein VR64_02895 [Desulfatitalea sp. BRH_c12]